MLLLHSSDNLFNLDSIDPSRNYWFIRTDSGEYFDTYLENGFIGIGWNQITLEDLTKLPEREVKVKIAKLFDIDLELSRGKAKASSIYHKLLRFKNIAAGDVVIIPSHSSSRLAFGIVEDTNVYIDVELGSRCGYYKRKKIRWEVVRNLGELDPIFYEIKISRHAISNVKRYENYIDRVISTFYFKSNFGNLVFEINQEKDINLLQLVELISSVQHLITEVNKYYGYGENVEESAIKLSLQSKGTLTLKVPNGNSLATFGLIFALFSCGDKDKTTEISTKLDPQKTEKFINDQRDTLTTARRKMTELKVDLDKLTNAFQ